MGRSRAWKGFDWDALGRLHAKDLIFHPVGKTKSVSLTDEGLKQCKEAFYRLFSGRTGDQAACDR